MIEEEHRTAWIEAEYIVLGWWYCYQNNEPNGFDVDGNLMHYYIG